MSRIVESSKSRHLSSEARLTSGSGRYWLDCWIKSYPRNPAKYEAVLDQCLDVGMARQATSKEVCSRPSGPRDEVLRGRWASIPEGRNPLARYGHPTHDKNTSQPSSEAISRFQYMPAGQIDIDGPALHHLKKRGNGAPCPMGLPGGPSSR